MSGADVMLMRGLEALATTDERMSRAIRAAGRPEMRNREPGFATLARTIVDQQVSVQAGAAIWSKLEDGIGGVTADAVLSAPENTLRQCGLSAAKVRYMRCLADAIGSGELDLESLERADDDEARARLTAITGIGRWTADIYLMFALGRLDVWPSGDLALAVAAQHLEGFEQRPTPKQLEEMGERWRPWRTVAALVLWHYYRHGRDQE